jgi:hypothetical protein
LGLLRSAAFAVRKNAKRELSFFLTAARAAGQSPSGLKGGEPRQPKMETVLEDNTNSMKPLENIPRPFI